MASGSYRRTMPPEPVQTIVPARSRATREFQVVKDRKQEERVTDEIINSPLPVTKPPKPTLRRAIIVDQYAEHPLTRHIPWLRPLIITMMVIVLGLLVLVSAGLFQRPSDGGNLVLSPYGNGQAFPMQVGGTYGVVNSWDNSNGPSTPKVPIPIHAGPYGVLGKPTLNVDFMNRVLAAYNSPAAGKAQSLYDLGVKYGIDPAFALSFFLHESTMGKYGWANVNLSLGNIRCVPAYPCNHGYSQYSSWEQGFEAWYKLIRNLYVAQWGLVTVDAIIPVYAPASDHNDEAAYIHSLKHTLDTWHAGQLIVA